MKEYKLEISNNDESCDRYWKQTTKFVSLAVYTAVTDGGH